LALVTFTAPVVRFTVNVPLKLVEVSGQIFAGEAAMGLKERIFSFGQHGHAVKLTIFHCEQIKVPSYPRQQSIVFS
jgi:hypothetical protein